jgi:hypothetical protein
MRCQNVEGYALKTKAFLSRPKGKRLLTRLEREGVCYQSRLTIAVLAATKIENPERAWEVVAWL